MKGLREGTGRHGGETGRPGGTAGMIAARGHYFNEFDAGAAAWLRELMADGLIPKGDVDERSITEVEPSDLKGYRQCHFFAGVSGWCLALRLAGVPDDEPLWTGSCPCQPFSAAGLRRGHEDERDLWPDFLRLIEACRPPEVWGEQVASSEVVGSQLEASFLVAVQAGEFARANKLAKQLATSRSFHFHPRWITRVRSGLAAADYSLRWGVLGAHSVGSPNIRQRLFWVADAATPRHTGARQAAGVHRDRSDTDAQRRFGLGESPGGCGTDGLAHAELQRTRRGTGQERTAEVGRDRSAIDGVDGGLAHADGGLAGHRGLQPGGKHRQQPQDGGVGERVGNAAGPRLEGSHTEHVPPGQVEGRLARGSNDPGSVDWPDSLAILCRDGKARRIPASAQSVLLGLAHGLPDDVDHVRLASLGFPLAGKVPNRVGLLRGFGNAINPYTAAAFIRACRGD